MTAFPKSAHSSTPKGGQRKHALRQWQQCHGSKQVSAEDNVQRMHTGHDRPRQIDVIEGMKGRRDGGYQNPRYGRPVGKAGGGHHQ